MNLDQLEALADAAMSPAPYEREQGQADLKAVGVPQTIKRLIALCRMQHEALADVIGTTGAVDEALEAFDKFNGGK